MTINFPAFDSYVCEGDSVTVHHNGFELVATIYHDDCPDAPDECCDGFWPSLDPNDDGYIGPKSVTTLRRHMARAQHVMDTWRNDEWFFCVVAVTVSRAGVELTGTYDHALWGVECNYPTFRKRDVPNAYLSEVADDLASEAMDAANVKLDELLEGLEQ